MTTQQLTRVPQADTGPVAGGRVDADPIERAPRRVRVDVVVTVAVLALLVGGRLVATVL